MTMITMNMTMITINMTMMTMKMTMITMNMTMITMNMTMMTMKMTTEDIPRFGPLNINDQLSSYSCICNHQDEQDYRLNRRLLNLFQYLFSP